VQPPAADRRAALAAWQSRRLATETGRHIRRAPTSSNSALVQLCSTVELGRALFGPSDKGGRGQRFSF
jgi:hypothetical protein